ncbi:MAG TPA: PAS domain S-box protein [Opitutaceae bacterium]|nr:PAS domain S-box protein [Opitutaceae bacterium]
MFHSLTASFWLPLIVLAVLGAPMIAVYWRWTVHLRHRAERLTVDLDVRVRERTAELERTITRLQQELARRDQLEADLRREHDMMETFMRSVPDTVYFKDADSRFIACSASKARKHGLAGPADLAGKTDFDLFGEEHARAAYEAEQRILRTGEALVGLPEKEVFHDGRVRWTLTSKMPLRDETGRIVGTFGLGKDMTELKNAEEELRQRELLFRLIFEHAPVGVSWRRADLGNVYHRNATFRRILGLTAEESSDDAQFDVLIHKEELGRYGEATRRIEAGEADSYTLEQRFVLKDGRLVWGRLSVAVVRNDSGHIIQEIAILEDITQRKQTEQELADTYKSLLDASRVAGMAEVATGVLHNIGNVLNSVNVSVNLLAENLQNTRLGNIARLSALLHEHVEDLGTFLTTDPQGQRVLPYLDTLADHLTGEQQRLLAEVDSLRRNVDHIKDIVGMQQEYAKVVGVIEALAPVDLVEDALRMNAAALTRHDVELVRQLAPAPAVIVERPKVLQILINLIRNAKYALDEGGRADKRLLVRLEHDAGCVRVIVCDNGIGIPPENLGRVFTHGFTTRKDGHGFGLHSSAVAAKEMGGRLTVHSDGPGRGATFTLELPRADVAAPAAPAVAAAAPRG